MTPMPDDRELLIRRAAERAMASVAKGQTPLGQGGLFELAYPFVAVEVSDASQEKVRAAFASIWGFDGNDRALYQRVLTACDRHDAGDDESIGDVLRRAAASGDLEAVYLLSLAATP
jgi:hypothetical protein